MASGVSMRGTPGRCYGFYVDFMDCGAKQKMINEQKAKPLIKSIQSQVKTLETSAGKESVDAAIEAIKSGDGGAPAAGMESFTKDLESLKNIQKGAVHCIHLREDYLECLHGTKQHLRDMIVLQRERQLIEEESAAHGH
mmetsp:Transcript_15550/g.20251  ORF Transcript_15550/g.20251 Transcript_15550/m.20251 type:complete len:139 (-) Transcript_15550:52-468(-)|eukprot:CAMPEP_0198150294 /NCGR_PEP_ID=MMETSP1443-20131203/50248_1 /TAXON_ID=186043 /ORGANISM="Entomoneis sp., Strain CCMP2396" /LENGTH=138 /DNA_ID=CAMNT_0043815563 /DNA_START=171 /DNA_END=587 /DNA_ORIENTATION=+